MNSWASLATALVFSCLALGCSAGGGAPDQGAICAQDADCMEHCVTGSHHQPPYCTGTCEEGLPCPDAYACISSGQNGLLCAMKSTCTIDTDCPSEFSCLIDEDQEEGACVQDGMECESDDACPAGVACNQGTCVSRCESDDDCKEGLHCQWRNRCTECTGNLHCSDGFACVGGLCNLGCVSDSNCRSGFACTGDACIKINGGGSGTIGAGCEEDGDCESFCDNGNCAVSCTGAGDNISCPSGFTCHDHHGVCNPE